MKNRLIAFAFLMSLAVAATPLQAIAVSTATRGPSTTTDPYVIPSADGVEITSLLTVNDSGSAGNGYEMVGLPDGLGYMVRDGKVVLVMNHEVRESQGIVRRHGQKGSFVSRLTIDPGTLSVTSGSDLINPSVRYWDYPSGTYVTSGPRFADSAPQSLALSRFCSATLSDPNEFRAGHFGYDGQIFLTNEEAGDAGRVLGVLADGTAQMLPRLSLASWENHVPAQTGGRATVVVGLEDGPRDGSQLWVYIGTKQDSGNPFDRAGLTNGASYVIDATNAAVINDAQWRATYGKNSARVTITSVDWNASGGVQNAQAKATGLSLNRIEDGQFDPRNPNDFYFLTTEGGAATTTTPFLRDGGGLWRLRWTNVNRPELGATLELLLDGSETIAPGATKLVNPDNLGIDRRGNVLLQEDPGNNAHLARIVAYRIRDGRLGVVAEFDPARYSPGAAQFMTADEESSGIVDAASAFGDGAFIFNAQIHSAIGLPAGTGPNTVEEYVENGQLLLLRVSSWRAVYGESEQD